MMSRQHGAVRWWTIEKFSFIDFKFKLMNWDDQSRMKIFDLIEQQRTLVDTRSLLEMLTVRAHAGMKNSEREGTELFFQLFFFILRFADVVARLA